VAAARPEILVVAGVNGAGKSSVAGARMQNAGGRFYNPDLHARELRVAQPGLSVEDANGQAWQHGRALLERGIITRVNFAFETTLGGTTIAQILRAAVASHDIHVLFVGLDSPERHIARVAARVRAGGHDIPEARIRARFISSRANLIGLVPVLASLRLYDNSIEVASGGTSIPLPIRLLEMERGVITYEAPRGSIPGWAKAIVQAARDHAR
jgi:predicted ABC-type ATPase